MILIPAEVVLRLATKILLLPAKVIFFANQCRLPVVAY